MLTGKKLFRVIFYLSILIISVSPAHSAKSLYVINDTETSQLQAYKIDGANLIHQIDYNCVTETSAGVGSVGIAIDESERGQFLFVTFEWSDEIELVNAKTMRYVDTVTAPGADDLAGIAMDIGKSKLYAVDRYTNHLYSWSWDPLTKILTPDFNAPYYIELQDISDELDKGAFGIALDEENGLFYVADNTDSIKYYDTNDWSKKGEVNNVSCNVIGIAIDVNNQLLYYGSIGYYGEGDPCLYQYDISAQSEDSVIVGSSVAGIAVDQNSSLVYLTTYGDGGSGTQDRLFVYDVNLTQQWASGDIRNPAGVAVGTTAQYKPPFPSLVFTKDDNDVNCVVPGDYITYTISYDANGQDVNDVNIIDYLPYEVDFNSASSPNSDYNSNNHTVTWNIGNLAPADSNCVYLTVKVNTAAHPTGTITNYCGIESDPYYTFATEDTNVCCWGGDIIYVEVNAFGLNTGLSWQRAYRDLQDALKRARKGCGTEIWVAAGTYKPTTDLDDYEATFQLIDGVGLYGGFAGNETSRSQRNWLKNKTTLTGDIDNDGDADVYVVTASDVTETAIIDGFTIKKGNLSGINIIGGSPTIQHNRITENREEGIYCQDTETPLITNNWIHHNDAFGIYFYSADAVATVRNNTVVYNTYYGIDRDGGTSPNITNCIIWGNIDGQLSGCDANYSCIEDYGGSGEGNIDDDPCFVDYANNNYHLSSDSNCIDAGDSNFTPDDQNETDIDGQRRVSDGDANGTYIVDMGADEYNRIPQDPHKFYIKNNSDETVAWFGNLGNIVLKRTFTSGETIDTAPDNSFIIADSTADIVAYVDNEGNLCIEGTWSELCGSCNPTTDAFIIKNSSDANVSYIEFDGDLCLTGGLYPNSNP